jgi:hypothetical protein
MKTYSGAINITHIGSIKFGLYNIFPVYYAPAGKCNLISVLQLEDHGFRVHHKNKLFILYMGLTIVKRFPCVGDLYFSTIAVPPVNKVEQITSSHAYSVTEKDALNDWHIILGHPSNVYVKKFLELMGIKKLTKTGSSSNCEVCRMAKLKCSLHSNPLHSASSPFKIIHMDVLQFTPLSRGSFKYILVLVDNFSWYNRIYLLQKKHKCKSKIMIFVKKIQSHLHITPAILHTNRGGEFGSSMFKSFLSQHGILLEQGQANSPQTNGLAKQFNQTILVKIRFMLEQSSVPLNYWDKAAQFASTLINMLPTSLLDWKSLLLVLGDVDSLMEQVRGVHTLLPFGLKAFVHNQKPTSKVAVPLKPLLFLGYEPKLDAMRFLDPISCRGVISHDYTPSILSFPYNSQSSMIKLSLTLPKSLLLPEDEFVFIELPVKKSAQHCDSSSRQVRTCTPTPSSRSPCQSSPSTLTRQSLLPDSPPRLVSPSSTPAPLSYVPIPPLICDAKPDVDSLQVKPPTKHFWFEWLPKDQLAPKDISSKIDPSNIVEGLCWQNRDFPDISLLTPPSYQKSI